jgi:hypothetical protein
VAARVEGRTASRATSVGVSKRRDPGVQESGGRQGVAQEAFTALIDHIEGKGVAAGIDLSYREPCDGTPRFVFDSESWELRPRLENVINDAS